MFQLCQKKSSSGNIKKSVSTPNVCQMYCAFCSNPKCNHGSICGHRNVPGTYGHRKTDQKDFHTTGRTHEAEHAVGFEPANRYNHFNRKSREGRAYENDLPAYQEEYGYHRANIGTGNRRTTDASGFNAQTYRDTQQALIDADEFATAVQLNQLTYAFVPGFSSAPYGTVADQSFRRMVHVPNVPVPNANRTGYVPRRLTIDERVEMAAARYAARTKQWPTAREIRKFRTEIRKGI